MMILTAKVDLKRILLILACAAALVLAAILTLGTGKKEAATSAPVSTGNDGRVQFLKDYGWEVNSTPVESGQVRIPEKSGEVFDRYNLLQLSQGYDLTEFAGKKVMRYVYQVTNYPGAKEPVYATVLVHRNKVIGGDITDTAVKGRIHGFRMPIPAPTGPSEAAVPMTEPAETVPAVPNQTHPTTKTSP